MEITPLSNSDVVPEQLQITPMSDNSILAEVDKLPMSPGTEKLVRAINFLGGSPNTPEQPITGFHEGPFFTPINPNHKDYKEIKRLSSIPKIPKSEKATRAYWQRIFDQKIIGLSNYCGPGGEGEAMHEVDQICQLHDKRYEDLVVNEGKTEDWVQKNWNSADEKMMEELYEVSQRTSINKDVRERLSFIAANMYLTNKKHGLLKLRSELRKRKHKMHGDGIFQ